jgi:hypothetical protein
MFGIGFIGILLGTSAHCGDAGSTVKGGVGLQSWDGDPARVRRLNHFAAAWLVSRSVRTVEQDGRECDIAHATIAMNAVVRHQARPRRASLKSFTSVMMVAITVLLHGWIVSLCSIFSLGRFLVPCGIADCVIFVASDVGVAR